MTPAQRQQLADIERRGFRMCEARDLARTMQRIDQRKPLQRSFTASKRARRWELIGACTLIAIGLAVLFFL